MSSPPPANLPTLSPELGNPPQTPAPSARVSLLARWMREPLLHFVLLGALLFLCDHILNGSDDDPRTIVVDKAVTDEARKVFRAARGQDPKPAELEALSRRWVDNEVLYREGLALGVEKGDTMIRDRVIFKSLMVIESGLTLPAVDDDKLRAWFEANRVKYDEPPRYDFQEAVLSGDISDQAVHAFVQTLNEGRPGETNAGLRVFKGRPASNLLQSYGSDFKKSLEEAPVGEWRALPTRDGLRAMRLESIIPARPATFEPLRNVVLADWTDATMAQLRTDAVRLRARKYTVKVDETGR